MKQIIGFGHLDLFTEIVFHIPDPATPLTLTSSPVWKRMEYDVPRIIRDSILQVGRENKQEYFLDEFLEVRC